MTKHSLPSPPPTPSLSLQYHLNCQYCLYVFVGRRQRYNILLVITSTFGRQTINYLVWPGFMPHDVYTCSIYDIYVYKYKYLCVCGYTHTCLSVASITRTIFYWAGRLFTQLTQGAAIEQFALCRDTFAGFTSGANFYRFTPDSFKLCTWS